MHREAGRAGRAGQQHGGLGRPGKNISKGQRDREKTCFGYQSWDTNRMGFSACVSLVLKDGEGRKKLC